MVTYIRLLSYKAAVSIIDYVKSLKSTGDRACIVPRGLELETSAENHPKILDFLSTLPYRVEFSEHHPQKEREI